MRVSENLWGESAYLACTQDGLAPGVIHEARLGPELPISVACRVILGHLVGRAGSAMNLNRRLRKLLLLSLMWASGAIAATLFSDAFNDLTKYFKAASTLLLQASVGLENTRFDTLSPAQRNSAKSQLENLRDRLDLIFREQTTLVNQFEFYVEIARDPSKTPAERKTYWNNSVLPRIRTVSEAVSEVRTFSDKPGQPFSVALSTDERIALGDTLAARGAALNTFENMGPPLSSDELLQFQGLIKHYRVLMTNLFKLRGAIDDALRRLSTA